MKQAGAAILRLNWTPDIKARKLLTVLSEEDNDDGVPFTWPQRQAHCKALETATSDTLICDELIEVSEINRQLTHVLIFDENKYI